MWKKCKSKKNGSHNKVGQNKGRCVKIYIFSKNMYCLCVQSSRREHKHSVGLKYFLTNEEGAQSASKAPLSALFSLLPLKASDAKAAWQQILQNEIANC